MGVFCLEILNRLSDLGKGEYPPQGKSTRFQFGQIHSLVRILEKPGKRKLRQCLPPASSPPKRKRKNPKRRKARQQNLLQYSQPMTPPKMKNKIKQ